MKLPCALVSFTLLAAFAASLPARAEPEKTEPAAVAEKSAETAPDKAADRFFKQLEGNDVNAAYDQLLRGSRIADSKEDVATLKAKTRQAIEECGSIAAHECTETKPAGTRLVRLTYLTLGKEYPLRWRLYFYKLGGDEAAWKLVDIRISDRLGEMFDEPAAPAAPATVAPASVTR